MKDDNNAISELADGGPILYQVWGDLVTSY